MYNLGGVWVFMNFKIFHTFKTVHKETLGKENVNHSTSELAATLETFHFTADDTGYHRRGVGLTLHSPGLRTPWVVL